jgi:hypothetical protein
MTLSHAALTDAAAALSISQVNAQSWSGDIVPVYCLQIRWIQEELWFPLAEWWIDTVLGTWEESVKVGRHNQLCNHGV